MMKDKAALPNSKPQKLLKFAAAAYLVYAVIATYGAIRSGSFGTGSILLLIVAGMLIYVAHRLTTLKTIHHQDNKDI